MASASSLQPEKLTWAVLLGRWVDFARSAVALPMDDEGQRMRRSIADVIMLQAVWFALQHLDELDPSERALALDRAGLLIERHTTAIDEAWAGAPRPAMLDELVRDAREQLARVRSAA